MIQNIQQPSCEHTIIKISVRATPDFCITNTGYDTTITQPLGVFNIYFLLLQYRTDFNNLVSIVVKTADSGSIMFDNKPVTNHAQWSTAWDYSYVSFPISHGMHIITVTSGSSATFGAYVYGHSLLDSSSSAYGYTVGYDRKDIVQNKALFCIIKLPYYYIT